MADTENKVDSTIGGLANLSNAPDDALLVVEYLGKSYNSTMAQLKAALGTITGFGKTAGDGTPGTNDVYTINFGNGKKLDITIPIPTNGKNGYTPQKGVDYHDGYTPQKGVDYHDGYTPQKGVDYADGISPTVDFKQMEDGVEITITDATGPHTAKLKNGADGVSPSFRVETIEGGYRVILSAAHEYQQFDLLNGEVGDWSVNNPADKNFIKGRTHSKEEYGVDGVVIEETSVAFSGTTQYQMISGIMSEAIQVGGKYTVTYNGVDYACIGKYYDGAYIGNGSFMNVGGGNEEDTGEPFCIQLFGGDFYMLWKADKTKETVTVKVVGEKVVIWHKLDMRYLEEGVPHVETSVAEILPETVIEADPDTGILSHPDRIELITGKTYTVKWNGTEYSCVAQDAIVPADEEGNMVNVGVVVGDFGLITGGESTGEPFMIVAANALGEQMLGAPTAIQSFDGSTSVTLSISGETTVFHQMPGGCLPKGTPSVIYHGNAILPGSVVSFVDGTAILAGPIGTVVVGANYEVRIGNDLFYCVAEQPVLNSSYAHIGNSSLPFDIHFIATGEYAFGYVDKDYDGELLSISAEYTVNKMDERCMVGANFFVVNAASDDFGNIESADMSFDEVRWRIENGGIPVLIVRTGNGNIYCYHFTLFVTTEMKFVYLEDNTTATWVRGSDHPTT